MNDTVLIAVGALVLLQVTLQIVALVQLVRTPSERVSLSGRKWLWAIIILLLELAGPILWFILGRTPKPAEAVPAAPAASVSAAADALYGKTPTDGASVPANDPQVGANGTGSGELP